MVIPSAASALNPGVRHDVELFPSHLKYLLLFGNSKQEALRILSFVNKRGKIEVCLWEKHWRKWKQMRKTRDDAATAWKKSTNFQQTNFASERPAALVNMQNNSVSAQRWMDLNYYLRKCLSLLIQIIRINTLLGCST